MKGTVLKILLLLLAVSLLAGCGTPAAEPTEPQTEDFQLPELPQESAADIAAEHGDVLQMKLEVAPNASGAHSYYAQMFTIPAEVVLEPGDMLVYDVYLYNELGGIGTIDLYAGDNVGVNLRDDVLSLDQHAVRNHPTANIAGLALNRWYNRRVNITDKFIETANAAPGKRGVALIACDIPDIKYFAGQTITLNFDNVCIMRGDQVVHTIFAGREDPTPREFNYMLGYSGNVYVNTTMTVINETKGEMIIVGDQTPAQTGPTAPVTDAMTQTVVYKQVGNKDLKMDIYQPLNKVYDKAPVLYLIVGGGWNTAVRQDMVNFLSGTVTQLREKGFAVTTVEYRVQNNGADMNDMISDCMDGIRYLVKYQEELGIAPEKIVTAGHSAGGYLSLMMALGQQAQYTADSQLSEHAYTLAGCVAISPVTVCYRIDGKLLTLSANLPYLFKDEIEARAASPLDILTADTCPILILTGEADNVVDPNNTYWFAEKAQELGADVTMLTSANAGHSYELMVEGESVSLSIADMYSKIAEFAVKQAD